MEMEALHRLARADGYDQKIYFKLHQPVVSIPGFDQFSLFLMSVDVALLPVFILMNHDGRVRHMFPQQQGCHISEVTG